MKKKLSENFGLKLISFLLAVLLWLIINGLTDPIMTKTIKDIPVTLQNEDSMSSIGKIFEVESSDKVDVKIRAKRSVLQGLEKEDFVAVADVKKMTELHGVSIVVSCPGYGENEVEILEKTTKDGTGMISLVLEDSDTQSFAVNVVADGVAAEGYYIAESLASPNLLTITGSKTQIARIEKIAVLVNVNEANESFVQTASPIVYDAQGNIISLSKISLSSEQVQVSMTLLPTKQIPIEVVASGAPFYQFECTGVEFAPNTVMIAGEDEELKKLSKLRLECDISHAMADVETVLSLSEFIKETHGNSVRLVNDSDKVSVKATIERMEMKEFEIHTSNIDILNLREDFTLSFPEQVKTLRAVAIPAVLETITGYNLHPYIDCRELSEPGVYSLPIFTQIPNNVIRAATVQVELKDVNALEDEEGLERETQGE